MSVRDLFNPEEITKTEEDIIIELFSQPVVKKYLRIMGRNDSMELISLSVTERDDKEISKKHALIQGKLAVITTLLSIEKPQSKE